MAFASYPREDCMASTRINPDHAAATYTVLVILTVDRDSDDSLRDEHSVRDEAQSWLESLRVTVHNVAVRSTRSAE
jgi:hypothetical protein